MLELYNCDCIDGSKKYILDKSVDLIICDPPFGIEETKFKSHYKRDSSIIIDGYVEAPDNYYDFTLKWVEQCKRILKENGTIYIISGWNNLSDILNSLKILELKVLNHCIWKYNFGVFTSKKFVSSHYHILRVSKSKDVTFNTNCRFGPQEKTYDGGSLLYKDLEDVFSINKEFSQKKIKNANKLPEELIKKLIQYSSNEYDIVCDFFMGNFTTATVGIGLNRKIIGFEINKNSFDYYLPILKELKFGYAIQSLKKVEIISPKNKGKRISKDEETSIINRFLELNKEKTKKDSIYVLQNEFQRGKFSIVNILMRNDF